MRTIFLLLVSCQLHPLMLQAQLSGTVSLPHAGIEFVIPDGWLGQETGDGYILGSNTEPGAVFLTSHQATTLDALRAEAAKGIYEDGGTHLMPEGGIQSFGENALAAQYAGMLQGQRVKAYGIGLINPHGMGVTILVVTTPELFTDRHRTLAETIARGMRFSKAEAAPIVDEWRSALQNARLTYMDSYTTTGGGYSDKTVIDLCSGGFFKHSRNYNMGVDVGGAFGSDHSASRGAGTWQVLQDATGNGVLQLTFHNGEVQEYTLQYANEKTLLNGTRYFRTYDAACP